MQPCALHASRALFPLALLATFAAPAMSQQDYPNRPIRVIVSSAAGGGSDFIVRPVVAKMGESMGQTFVVDNRAGASGIIAMEITAKAAPDGYTLLLGTIGNFASNTALHAKLPFDPSRCRSWSIRRSCCRCTRRFRRTR